MSYSSMSDISMDSSDESPGRALIVYEMVGDRTFEECKNNPEYETLQIPIAESSPDDLSNFQSNNPNPDIGNFEPCKLLRIKPLESLSFGCTFTPLDVGISSLSVPLHILHNPYEQMVVKLVGEGYEKDILIRGLACKDLSSSRGSALGLLGYSLEFGGCLVKEQYPKRFLIQNNTQHIVRFEIIQESSSSEILFVPSVGHIFRSSTKAVTACLLATEPKELSVTISVVHNGIVYKDDTIAVKEWDNSYKILSRLEEKKIIIDKKKLLVEVVDSPVEEPEVVLLSFVSGELVIRASGTVDRPRLDVPLNEISYNPVLVGHVDTRTLQLRNNSKVEVPFQLSIIDEDISKSKEIITEFSFGKFSYNLKKVSSDDKEPLDINVNYNWPTSLPPDLDSYDYYNIFYERQEESDVDKWEYLKMKQMCLLHSVKDSEKDEGDRGFSAKSDNIGDTIKHTQPTTPNQIEDVFFQNDIANESRSLNQSVFSTDIRCGTVKPNEDFDISVNFSPREVTLYSSIIRLSTKSEEAQDVCTLSGSGFLPLCHIEIEENDDYILRNNILLTNLPYRTKPITITSFSTQSVITKIFNVYNITEIPFQFKWYCLKNSGTENKFKCFTNEGRIQPRSKGEMLFSFCSPEDGLYESLWMLCIKEFLLQQPLLFVGISKEPEVSIDPKCVFLRPAYKNSRALEEVRLTNHEDYSFGFSVNEETFSVLKSLGRSFTVTPMQGTIGPRSTLKFIVEYLGDRQGEEYLVVEILLEPSKKVVAFNVILQDYLISPEIYCLKEDGETLDLTSPDKESHHTISVGNMCSPFFLARKCHSRAVALLTTTMYTTHYKFGITGPTLL